MRRLTSRNTRARCRAPSAVWNSTDAGVLTQQAAQARSFFLVLLMKDRRGKPQLGTCMRFHHAACDHVRGLLWRGTCSRLREGQAEQRHCEHRSYNHPNRSHGIVHAWLDSQVPQDGAGHNRVYRPRIYQESQPRSLARMARARHDDFDVRQTHSRPSGFWPFSSRQSWITSRTRFINVSRFLAWV